MTQLSKGNSHKAQGMLHTHQVIFKMICYVQWLKQLGVKSQLILSIYSILADETRDCSRKEQLSIVVRCVDVDTASVYEHFLTFTEAATQNTESLCALILQTLDTFKLDPAAIVSEGYDGASVMSGRCLGVQQQIKRVAPQAVYVHCYAHYLCPR